MRFKIYRTSDPYLTFNETPPCKNAILVKEQEPVVEWIRDENNVGWLQNDTGIRKIVKHWEVDINTLEELMELEADVEHPLIISSDDDDSPEIEIYNSYRE